MHRIELIKKAINSIGLKCSDIQAQQTTLYLDSVLEWNEKINLISKNDKDKLLIRHFIDSIKMLSLLKIKENAKIMDIGSGGGFPSIPIKIIRPDLNITAIESSRKKSLFLNEAIKKLSLKNFNIINNRLIKKTPKTETYDICTSRAVMELRDFIKLCKDYVSEKGFFCTFKHKNSFEKEKKHFLSNNISKHYKIDNVFEYQLNEEHKNFLLVTIKSYK